MKSIRDTLIVYFLLLLTAALAAVSWSSYRTTAHALRQREVDARKLIEKRCEERCETVRDNLNKRILHQAVAMANTRLTTLPYDVIHAVGLFGAASPMPNTRPYFAISWWAPATPRDQKNPNLEPMPREAPPYVPQWVYHRDKEQKLFNFFAAYPRFTNIESAEAGVAHGDEEHSQEYFQTFRGKQVISPVQRSASMGESWFELDEKLRDPKNHLYEYDEVELKPGLRLTRVTLKIPAQGGQFAFPPRGKGPPPKGVGQNQGPPPPGGIRLSYIQYAADLGPIEKQITQFRSDRDAQIAELAETIDRDLSELRFRMFWIGMGTLMALLVGGFVVIRLGLRPLAKMTDAVRRVSAKNFHLELDPAKLPLELQPIATRLEESLQELRKAFAREKQAAADISHELRTPLAALMTTLEVGLKKTRSPQEYREILDECRLSGQHMYHLVERLLTLARLDAGADQYRPADVDVTATALNCADLIRPLARARGLELRLNLPDTIVTRTDGDKLSEVLVNLLHNAVEYNKPNGSIELSVEPQNGHVRFEVRDTGIGITPQAREHIFERFYRADASRHADTPHAGLGLAIVKSYVDLMGGTIRVDSNAGGTAFSVELPFVAASLSTAVRAVAAV